MAEPLTTPTTPTTQRPAIYMRTMVVGRVEEVSRFEGMYYTRIVCPAEDEYSQPQMVKIRSKTRIGSREEIVTCKCRIGGYKRKPYKAVDKETGEQVFVNPVDMTLDLIE